MKRIIHATIVFIVFSSAGCGKEYSRQMIDSDIGVRMWEILDSTKRILQIRCATEKYYNCMNYQISKTIRKTSDKIDIHFNGILVSDVCLTAFGPATTIIDLGKLSNRTYNLNIKVEGYKNEGKLIVTSEYYAIELNNQNQIQIANNILYRIPANTIWGTVGYHIGSTEPLAQTFIDSLQFFGATAQTYQPGNYGEFEIESSGQIIVPTSYNFRQPFVFNYSGNTSKLKRLVKSYGANYGDSLSIILHTTKGEIFRSWMQ
jgi:hypothetical protein